MMKQTEKKGGKNVERLLRDSPLVRWVFQRLRALREQGRKSCRGSATGQRGKEGKKGSEDVRLGARPANHSSPLSEP